jgi:hypothetical protein
MLAEMLEMLAQMLGQMLGPLRCWLLRCFRCYWQIAGRCWQMLADDTGLADVAGRMVQRLK